MDLELDHVAVVNMIGRKAKTFEIRTFQQTVLRQEVRTYQIGISGKGAKRLIGRIAVAGRSQGQHLPPGLPGADQTLDPGVRCRAKVADAIGTWQRGGMQKDAR